MKYTLTLPIELPRERVAELFSNSDNWHQWLESLISFEPISGSHGDVGSKTKMLHKLGSNKIEMTGTIESNTLPEEMVCIYEADNVWNRVVNRFTELSANETQWELESEFQCRGFVKIMALLMPGMFKKATKKDMEAFKSFAESNG